MRRFSKASIKKILETNGNGRTGAFATEDMSYISNGVFMIPNNGLFNRDLKLNENFAAKRFREKIVPVVKEALSKCTNKYIYKKDIVRDEDTLCCYTNNNVNIYFNKKFLQVIYQVMNDITDFTGIPLYVNPELVNKGTCSFLGCAIMPLANYKERNNG